MPRVRNKHTGRVVEITPESKWIDHPDFQRLPDEPPQPARLPTGFPARSLLLAAGFDSLASVEAASDETLLAVEGIGTASLNRIRSWS